MCFKKIASGKRFAALVGIRRAAEQPKREN
jgi:hypothetical protein